MGARVVIEYQGDADEGSSQWVEVTQILNRAGATHVRREPVDASKSIVTAVLDEDIIDEVFSQLKMLGSIGRVERDQFKEGF